MQGSKQKKKVVFNDFSTEDKNKLVGAFVWLLKEDKKQNPAFYQLKTVKK